MELTAGTIIGGDFRTLHAIGSGGMGIVYAAEQVSTGARRALKVMRSDFVTQGDLRRRFELEARVSSNLQSEHIVRVLAAGVDDRLGRPYIAMELLEGESLAAIVARRGRLPPRDVAAILAQVCHGLGEAHAQGIVHRDLKPANVFLERPRREGVRFTAKILDFGIAKIVADVAGQLTRPIGTPLWMAPEQTRPDAPVGPHSDVWALGLLAFYLLTGHPYWRAATPRADAWVLLREILAEPIVAASQRARELGVELPPGFDAWFARCVARDRAQRFASAAEARAGLLSALGAPFAEDLGAMGSPTVSDHQTTQPWRRPPRKRRALAIAAGVVFAGTLALAAASTLGAWDADETTDPDDEDANATTRRPTRARSSASTEPDDGWITDRSIGVRSRTVVVVARPPERLAEKFRGMLDADDNDDWRAFVGGFVNGGTGSGFVVVRSVAGKRKTFVVTNRHVVEHSVATDLAFDDGARFAGAAIVYVDPRYDVAVLAFSGETAPFQTGLQVSSAEIADLARVTAAGFPVLSGKPSFQIATGEVRNRRFEWEDEVTKEKSTYIQHSASINPGQSGGPLLGPDNAVVGVNTAFLQGKNDVYLAVPASAVEEAVAKAYQIQDDRPSGERMTQRLVEACRELAGELGSPAPRIKIFQRFISNKFVESDGIESVARLVAAFSRGDESDERAAAFLRDVFQRDPMDAMRFSILLRFTRYAAERGGVVANACGDVNPSDAKEITQLESIRMRLALRNEDVELAWAFEHGHWRVAKSPLD